jgi:hypothetical protein
MQKPKQAAAFPPGSAFLGPSPADIPAGSQQIVSSFMCWWLSRYNELTMGARKTPMTQEERNIAAQRCRERNAARHAAWKASVAGQEAASPGCPARDMSPRPEPRVLGTPLPWRERIQWVLDHLRQKKLADVPDEATWALWEHANKDRQSFMDKYVPMLARAEQAEADKRSERQEDPGGDEALRLAREWVERWRATHPTAQ